MLIKFYRHINIDMIYCQMQLLIDQGNEDAQKMSKYVNRRRSSTIWDILIEICLHINIDKI